MSRVSCFFLTHSVVELWAGPGFGSHPCAVDYKPPAHKKCTKKLYKEPSEAPHSVLYTLDYYYFALSNIDPEG